jgi:regulator of cell morphogenesis and NO signaling
VANPIRTMQEEHDQVGRLMRRMRDLSSDFTAPEGACESRRRLFKGLADLEADLRQHLHLENNVLFPKAEALEHSKIPECASPPCFLIEF